MFWRSLFARGLFQSPKYSFYCKLYWASRTFTRISSAIDEKCTDQLKFLATTNSQMSLLEKVKFFTFVNYSPSRFSGVPYIHYDTSLFPKIFEIFRKRVEAEKVNFLRFQKYFETYGMISRQLLHRLSKNVQVRTQASKAQNTWCIGLLVYIENCMGKSPIVKKCINNYLKQKVFLPRMCHVFVSCMCRF